MHFQMRKVYTFSYCAKLFHIEYKSTDNPTAFHETWLNYRYLLWWQNFIQESKLDRNYNKKFILWYFLYQRIVYVKIVFCVVFIRLYKSRNTSRFNLWMKSTHSMNMIIMTLCILHIDLCILSIVKFSPWWQIM